MDSPNEFNLGSLQPEQLNVIIEAESICQRAFTEWIDEQAQQPELIKAVNKIERHYNHKVYAATGAAALVCVGIGVAFGMLAKKK
jgi:hypothetical protein